ncbi:MmcQ/YjbR family DNA-binding protein [Armatimonas sp.]|uniref:MmcQ/YjbR family DNA-binding protein n=1 Tax=Armatimonas sp. TaxID=1872638 RepID=UPI00374C98E8
MTDTDDVERIALSFPETFHEDTGFRVRKKGFCWYYAQKVPGVKGRTLHLDVLAVRVANEDEKQALIAADPTKFFTDDHYRGFPAVLVRLPALDADELAELIEEAWRIQAPKSLVREFDAANL